MMPSTSKSADGLGMSFLSARLDSESRGEETTPQRYRCGINIYTDKGGLAFPVEKEKR